MEQVTANTLSPDGMRSVVIVSDEPIDSERWRAAAPGEARDAIIFEASKDGALGIHKLMMTWPAYEAVEFHCEGWPKPRRMLVVKLLHGERVSEAISAAKISFYLQTGFFPRLIFMRRLPSGAENGMLVDGVILMEAEWAIDGCIILGGRDG